MASRHYAAATDNFDHTAAVLKKIRRRASLLYPRHAVQLIC
jgi:hypothetical protein